MTDIDLVVGMSAAWHAPAERLMRYVFWFWFVPMGFLWSWYYLSYYDVGLGLSLFSRPTHDLVFAIYGHVLGMDKPTIIGLLVKACIVDTFIIMSILAFRRRRQIAAWWKSRRSRPVGGEGEPDQVSPAAE